MSLKVASLAMLTILVAAASAHAGELRVEVRGLAANAGTVAIALFDGAETFLKTPLSGQRVPAVADVAIAVFPNLGAGQYAVSAFHDLNENGKLDRNILGRPVEPLGFSRDASAASGPPAFDAAKITLGAENQSIVINLR